MTAVIPEQRAEPDPAESWQLVVRSQAGDRSAFADLYRRYHDTVFRFVYFRVGDRHLAEDLVGDVWVRAFNRISGVEWQGRDIGAWLVTIARNRVADHYKSGRYRLEITTGDVLDTDVLDNRETSEVETRELRAAFDDALSRITREQATVVRLRFLADLSVEETATAMGLTVGACKALQWRAMRALRRIPHLETYR